MSESKLSLEQRAMQGASLTMEERRKLWLSISDISEAQFDALQTEQRARQVRVPQPGTEAPDFELDVLSRERGRSSEKVRLSSLRGKPVGLVFGSYT
ncbi:MAG: hypothetical protein A3I01_06270 [Betaproteobacteria bacterium RIFCSPLOWO2_02_FULL_65_24]|nr:MAG: hypothetical protein A3I01_06270 [Betaproteobacteria bacterium RIFCSPLOWO2_02_FULL_65_24]